MTPHRFHYDGASLCTRLFLSGPHPTFRCVLTRARNSADTTYAHRPTHSRAWMSLLPSSTLENFRHTLTKPFHCKMLPRHLRTALDLGKGGWASTLARSPSQCSRQAALLGLLGEFPLLSRQNQSQTCHQSGPCLWSSFKKKSLLFLFRRDKKKTKMVSLKIFKTRNTFYYLPKST